MDQGEDSVFMGFSWSWFERPYYDDRWWPVLPDTKLSFVCENEAPQGKCPGSWNLWAGPFKLEDGFRCYQYVEERMTQTDASSHCELLGGHLTSIKSPRENEIVNEMCGGPHRFESCWLGIHFNHDEGHYESIYGVEQEEYQYTNWYNGKKLPDGNPGKKTGVMIGWIEPDIVPYWFDVPGDYTFPFICEYNNNNESCPKHWVKYNGHCYLKINDRKTYYDALEICRRKNENAYIANIESAPENGFVSHLCGSDTPCWIGLVEDEEYWGDWYWLNAENGEPQMAKYTNWAEGEPNNYGDRDEKFAMIGWYAHYFEKGLERGYRRRQLEEKVQSQMKNNFFQHGRKLDYKEDEEKKRAWMKENDEDSEAWDEMVKEWENKEKENDWEQEEEKKRAWMKENDEDSEAWDEMVNEWEKEKKEKEDHEIDDDDDVWKKKEKYMEENRDDFTDEEREKWEKAKAEKEKKDHHTKDHYKKDRRRKHNGGVNAHTYNDGSRYDSYWYGVQEWLNFPFICEADKTDRCPRVYKEANGSCYLPMLEHKLSFWDAQDACEAKDGYLVRIETEKENWYIRKLCGDGLYPCWIGMEMEPKMKHWKWVGSQGKDINFEDDFTKFAGSFYEERELYDLPTVLILGFNYRYFETGQALEKKWRDPRFAPNAPPKNRFPHWYDIPAHHYARMKGFAILANVILSLYILLRLPYVIRPCGLRFIMFVEFLLLVLLVPMMFFPTLNYVHASFWRCPNVEGIIHIILSYSQFFTVITLLRRTNWIRKLSKVMDLSKKDDFYPRDDDPARSPRIQRLSTPEKPEDDGSYPRTQEGLGQNPYYQEVVGVPVKGADLGTQPFVDGSVVQGPTPPTFVVAPTPGTAPVHYPEMTTPAPELAPPVRENTVPVAQDNTDTPHQEVPTGAPVYVADRSMSDLPNMDQNFPSIPELPTSPNTDDQNQNDMNDRWRDLYLGKDKKTTDI